MSLFHAGTFKALACFEHSVFLKVNEPLAGLRPIKARAGYDRMHDARLVAQPKGSEPSTSHRNPTTSFLTATTLVYVTGAGITAAAGTRLALQLLLGGDFTSTPFELQISSETCTPIACHCLVMVFTLGKLHACCLP